MKSAAVFLVILSTLFLIGAGCKGSPYQTGARFDTTYDFSTVDSFAFDPRREKAAESEAGKILEQAVREQLVERGYVEAPKADADVLISYDVGVYARAALSGRNTFPQSKGGLTVQVFDHASGASIWYGWSEAIVGDGGDAEQVIRAATEALFDDQIPRAD